MVDKLTYPATNAIAEHIGEVLVTQGLQRLHRATLAPFLDPHIQGPDLLE